MTVPLLYYSLRSTQDKRAREAGAGDAAEPSEPLLTTEA
jgi:hypothetical protein